LDPSFSKIEKRQLAERSWLLYYNRYLHDCGLISVETRNKMITMINARYRPAERNRDLAFS